VELLDKPDHSFQVFQGKIDPGRVDETVDAIKIALRCQLDGNAQRHRVHPQSLRSCLILNQDPLAGERRENLFNVFSHVPSDRDLIGFAYPFHDGIEAVGAVAKVPHELRQGVENMYGPLSRVIQNALVVECAGKNVILS
jgi:hypothetical protein